MTNKRRNKRVMRLKEREENEDTSHRNKYTKIKKSGKTVLRKGGKTVLRFAKKYFNNAKHNIDKRYKF